MGFGLQWLWIVGKVVVVLSCGLIVVMVAVGGQEKERIRAIGLQRFVGFKFFVFIFLLFGCGFVLQMSC